MTDYTIVKHRFLNVKQWPDWQDVVFHTVAKGVSFPCLDVFGRNIDTCLNPLGLAIRYPGPIHLCDLLSWLTTSIDGDGELYMLRMDFDQGSRFALDDGHYHRESQEILCAMLNHHCLTYRLPATTTCRQVSTFMGFLCGGDAFANMLRTCAKMSRFDLQNYLYQQTDRTAPSPFEEAPAKLTDRDYQTLQRWVNRFFPSHQTE